MAKRCACGPPRKQFFIVYSPEGPTPPVVAHPSHKAALWQAYELAKKHPESTFYVMGSMSKPCTAAEAKQPEEIEA